MSRDRSEHWRPVVGWEKFYRVSDRGRVKSLTRIEQIANRWGGFTTRVRRGRILKRKNIDGYFGVCLADGAHKYKYVHQLVAEAFIGPCPDGMQVNHKNGRKAECGVKNLEYKTPLDNTRHAHALGLIRPQAGEGNYAAKLTNAQAAEIRRRYIPWLVTQQFLANEYGVSSSTIGLIIANKTFRSAS